MIDVDHQGALSFTAAVGQTTGSDLRSDPPTGATLNMGVLATLEVETRLSERIAGGLAAHYEYHWYPNWYRLPELGGGVQKRHVPSMLLFISPKYGNSFFRHGPRIGLGFAQYIETPATAAGRQVESRPLAEVGYYVNGIEGLANVFGGAALQAGTAGRDGAFVSFTWLLGVTFLPSGR